VTEIGSGLDQCTISRVGPRDDRRRVAEVVGPVSWAPTLPIGGCILAWDNGLVNRTLLNRTLPNLADYLR
jgi:hypothetical protein